ncbi:MAG: alkaline phosphatase D family protein [Planctomycetota bacterium]
MKYSALTLAIVCAAPIACAQGPAVSVIAFGSCAYDDKPQPIWDEIIARDPDLFLFIGDNTYADVPDVPTNAAEIADDWAALGAKPGYQRMKAHCPIHAIWDDHDYGLNDAGKEWHLKAEAQELFLDFFDVPSDDPRRSREGIYFSETFGPPGKRLQVIMLDTRYFRDGLNERKLEFRAADGLGPYSPRLYGQGTLLGDAQWEWLEEELSEPADVRIIASSIQVVAREHGWECWGNFPHELDRLMDLIDNTKASGVFFISGDRHLMELSVDEAIGPYEIWDFTSSGLTQPVEPIDDPNSYRRGDVVRDTNYGILRIEWELDDPWINFEGYGRDGKVHVTDRVRLSSLHNE